MAPAEMRLNHLEGPSGFVGNEEEKRWWMLCLILGGGGYCFLKDNMHSANISTSSH